MTLILTALNYGGVVQVVDRLLTRSTPAGLQRFDPNANKTIVLATRDALLSIAYTGLAFLEGVPTDEWLVRTITHKPIARGSDNVRPATISFVDSATWPDLGLVVNRLSDGLALAFTRLNPPDWREMPLTIIAAGWLLYRRRVPRPVAVTIAKAKGIAPVVTQWMPRYIGRRTYLAALPFGQMPKSEHSELLRQVAEVPMDQAEPILVKGLRSVSAREGTVGDQVTCVTISPPQYGSARVRYDSLKPDFARVTIRGRDLKVPVAFTPWILTPGMIEAPSIVSGPTTSQRQVGPWTLDLGGGPSDEESGLLALHFSQQRPRQP